MKDKPKVALAIRRLERWPATEGGVTVTTMQRLAQRWNNQQWWALALVSSWRGGTRRRRSQLLTGALPPESTGDGDALLECNAADAQVYTLSIALE